MFAAKFKSQQVADEFKTVFEMGIKEAKELGEVTTAAPEQKGMVEGKDKTPTPYFILALKISFGKKSF